MTCSISSALSRERVGRSGVGALRERQRLAASNFRLPVPHPGALVVSPPARMGNGESKVTGDFDGEDTPDVKAGRRGLLNPKPLPEDCLTLARFLKPTGVLLTPEAQEYEVSRTWQANPLLQVQ